VRKRNRVCVCVSNTGIHTHTNKFTHLHTPLRVHAQEIWDSLRFTIFNPSTLAWSAIGVLQHVATRCGVLQCVTVLCASVAIRGGYDE